jgi:hypothetical protein
MNIFKNLIFVVIFVSFVSILIGQENESTNPAKPMVEALKLSAYDSALDKINYDVPYYKIRWSWKDDVQRREKRLSAIKKLLTTNAGIHDEGYSNIEYEFYNQAIDAYVRRMGWSWNYSELDNTLEIPDKVDDTLLAETLPYIPEIEQISLRLTKVTDKGLESLFYLPVLKDVSIETPDSDYILPITSQGIVLISKLPLLDDLFVRGVCLSDESLKEIAKNGKQLKRFMYWVYWDDTVSDKGIAYLKEMPRLESLFFEYSVAKTAKRNTSPKLTSRIFIPLSQSQSLKHIAFDNYDFLQIPDKETLNAIKNLKNTKIISVTLNHTKVHPLLVKSLCDLQSLIGVRFFDSVPMLLKFNNENPISYEKVMYRLKQKNQVPEYYLELEKPYFDEFYSHKWTSIDGKFTREACFIDLKEHQVILKLKGETKEITVPFEKLSKEDQKYVQQIVGE